MLNRRRKLLSFLRASNFERYALTLHRLGLKDTYAKQARARPSITRCAPRCIMQQMLTRCACCRECCTPLLPRARRCR